MRLVVSDLLPNQKYAVQVRASANGTRKSEFGPLFQFQTIEDVSPPQTPTGLTWVSVGDAFYAEWNAVTKNTQDSNIQVVSYELQLVGNGVTKTVSVPQQTGEKVNYTLPLESNRALFGVPSPTVTLRIRAVDKKGLKSNYTAIVSASNPIPDAPTAAVVRVGVDQINISWTPPTDTSDIIAYNVYVGSSSSFTPSTANKIYSGLSTAFTYTTTTYTRQYFKIRSQDVFLQESADLVADATPNTPGGADTTAPDTPTNFTAALTNNATGIGSRASLTWSQSNPAANDLAGFYVRFRRVGDTNWTVVNFHRDDRAGTLELQAAYTNYEFQIKSFDWSNNESAWTGTVTATSPANAAPSNVTGFTSTPARDGIRYDWTPVSDADVRDYEVTFSTSSTFSSGNTTFRASGNTLTVSGLTPATTYYSRIRAVDTQGLTSAAWSSTDTETTLSASSSVSVSDLTGGTIQNIDIVLGPSANMIVNGGAIKSNTYTGTTASNSNGSAGFYLGNDGLTINRGTVKAEAISGGTFNAGTINIAAGGAITGGSWTLNNSGLTIPDGGIAASKLVLQTGSNIMPSVYSDFEVPNTTGLFEFANLTPQINSGGRFNSNSLGLRWTTAQSANPIIYMAPTSTTYNIPVIASTVYIFSAYFWNPTAVSTNIQMKVKWSTGAVTTLVTNSGLATNVTSPANATRLAFYATAPTGATGAVLYFESSTLTANAGMNIDGIQVEARTSNNNNPSPWNPGSATYINGGQIRTGEIRSTEVAKVTRVQPIYTKDASGITIISGYEAPTEVMDPSGRPAWLVNTQGAAEFANLSVRGNVVVGTPQGTGVDSSGDYVENDSFQVTITNGSNVVNSPSNNFKLGDRDKTITASGIPAGTTIIQVVDSGRVIISANSTNTATVTATVPRTKRLVSTVSSSNYVQGESGWTLRSDGSAEFRDLAADLVTAKVLATGAVTGSHLADVVEVRSTLNIGDRLRLSDTNGLQVFSSENNILANFPSDGSSINLKADVQAYSLTTLDNFAMRGTNNEIGRGSMFKISSGTTPPKSPPTFTPYHDRKSISIAGSYYSGMAKSFNPNAILVYSQNQVREFVYSSNQYSLVGAVVNLGGEISNNIPISLATLEVSGEKILWVLGKSTTDVHYTQTRNGVTYYYYHYRLYKYAFSTNNTWVYQGSVRYHPDTGHGNSSVYHPCLGVAHDTNNIIVSQCGTDNVARIFEYGGGGGNYLGALTLYAGGSPWGIARHYMPVIRGVFDFNDSKSRIYIGLDSTFIAFNTAGNAGGPSDGTDFTSNFDTGGPVNKGIIWDPTSNSFKSVSPESNIVTHHTSIKAPYSVKVANTWVKANGTAPNYAQYETALGAVRDAAVIVRGRYTINTTELPANIDADSPNATNIYINVNNSGTMTGFLLHSTPRGGSTSFDSGTLFLNGVAHGAISGFPNSSPAQLTDNSGNFIKLLGDGSWKFDYRYNLGDTGWQDVGAAGKPAFENGWTNYADQDPQWQTAQYRRVENKVYIRGLVRSGSISAAIFTLPVGFRPIKSQMLVGTSNGINYSGSTNDLDRNSYAQNTGSAHIHATKVGLVPFSFGIGGTAHRMDVSQSGAVVANGGNQGNAWFSIWCEFFID